MENNVEKKLFLAWKLRSGEKLDQFFKGPRKI